MKTRFIHVSSIVSLLFLLPLTGQAQNFTIWSGPDTTITKNNFADFTLAENQDRITANVWLTRGADDGLYNIAKEGSESSSSPSGTKWALGTTKQLGTGELEFTTLKTAANNKMKEAPGKAFVLYLEEEDVYIDVTFVSWTSGKSAGGGFSYKRSTKQTVDPVDSLVVPTLIAPLDNDSLESRVVEFRWSSVENSTAYEFQITREDEFVEPIFVDSVADTTLALNLSYENTFQWRVRAHFSDTVGSWAVSAEFTTPDREINIQAVSPSDGAEVNTTRPQLVWSGISDATNYMYTINQGMLTVVIDEGETTDTTAITAELTAGEYSWYVLAYNAFGLIGTSGDPISFTIPVGTEVEVSELPDEFILKQNYPNPFNPTTQIDFTLPFATDIQLTLFNILGAKVVDLVSGRMEAGSHTITVDASGLPSGQYFYRLKTAEFTSMKSMILVK